MSTTYKCNSPTPGIMYYSKIVCKNKFKCIQNVKIKINKRNLPYIFQFREYSFEKLLP